MALAKNAQVTQQMALWDFTDKNEADNKAHGHVVPFVSPSK